jgi:hypothetical protein
MRVDVGLPLMFWCTRSGTLSDQTFLPLLSAYSSGSSG